MTESPDDLPLLNDPPAEPIEATAIPETDHDTDAEGHAATPGNVSKSRRVRQYLEEFPDATNEQVMNALEPFAVKYSDVANARQYLKKTQDKNSAGKPASRPGRPPRQSSEAPTKATTKIMPTKAPANKRIPAPVSRPPANRPAAVPTKSSEGDTVDFRLVQAGLDFIKQCGDLDKAEQVLRFIRLVREM